MNAPTSQSTAAAVGGGKRLTLANLVPPQQQQLGKNDQLASVFAEMGHIYKINGDVHVSSIRLMILIQQEQIYYQSYSLSSFPSQKMPPFQLILCL